MSLVERHSDTVWGVRHHNLVGQPQQLEGAEVRFGDVSNVRSLADTAFSDPVDVVVSCLASRTGGKVSAETLCNNQIYWAACYFRVVAVAAVPL